MEKIKLKGYNKKQISPGIENAKINNFQVNIKLIYYIIYFLLIYYLLLIFFIIIIDILI